MRSIVTRIAKLLYLPAVAIGIFLLVYWRWNTVEPILRQLSPGWMVLAFGVSVLVLVPQAWFWRKALGGFGEDITTGAVVGATCRAIMSRYLPGGVWFAAARAAILGKRGVGLPALAATGTVEVVLTVAVSLGLGTGLLGISPNVPEWSRWLGPGVVIGMYLGVPYLNRTIVWLARRRKTALPNPLTRRMILDLVGITVIYWLVLGTVFWLYAVAFGIQAPMVTTYGAFMVGWGVAFLSPFAPQGLGVFEVIIAAILGGGLIDMATIVLGFRGLMLVRDLVIWMVAEGWHRQDPGPRPS